MRPYLEDRVIREAELMIENKMTVRSLAQRAGVSKSTIHKDLSERLPYLNYELYLECQKVIQ